MLRADQLSEIMFRHKQNSEQFVKSKSISFDEAYEMCRKFININSKKSTAMKEGEEAKEESVRLINTFVNKLDLPVDGYEEEGWKERLRKDIRDEIVEYKAITDLMEDRLVDEIRINNKDTIFYEKKGELHKHDKVFKNVEELGKIIEKLLGDDVRLSVSKPFLNGRTPEGWRVNATHPSISRFGDYTAVIRKFKQAEDKLRIQDLIKGGSMSDNMATLLNTLPKARFSFVTVGGTGSGKTVTNEILLNGVPKLDRMVIIEDPNELTPEKINQETGEMENDFIQLKARSDLGGSAKPTDPTPNNLLENALRQTPIWIILGETRSDEQFAVLLKAAQTGHKVITTYHAEDPEDAVRRYLTAYMSHAVSVPPELALQNICEAFRFIVNVKKLEDGSRKVMYISEITGSEGLKPHINHIYEFQIEKVTIEGKIIGRHKRVGKLSEKTIKQLRESAIHEDYYKIFTEDPSDDEEEMYLGSYQNTNI